MPKLECPDAARELHAGVAAVRDLAEAFATLATSLAAHEGYPEPHALLRYADLLRREIDRLDLLIDREVA
jgi:hypothetical protein